VSTLLVLPGCCALWCASVAGCLAVAGPLLLLERVTR
jgi:hypothetical protein